MGAARLQGFTKKSEVYKYVGGGDSGWQDAGGIAAPFTLVVRGMVTNDILQVRASNDPSQPSGGPSDTAGAVADQAREGDLGVLLGVVDQSSATGAVVTSIIADGVYAVRAPVAWIRVLLTVKAGGGSISVAIVGQRPPMS